MHFKLLTLDVLLKRSLCVTIFEQVCRLRVGGFQLTTNGDEKTNYI